MLMLISLHCICFVVNVLVEAMSPILLKNSLEQVFHRQYIGILFQAIVATLHTYHRIMNYGF